ncbi:GNAT family N-acetyltransferase [Alteribacter populi]|uniref:GNAT family N-acetyltransferase n=1 Tax=Alteribacter populi TaxID=2011011 RepID=UPI000BBB47FF|nr:GNAT family N-acetyltransferase [Alteribacter populi]
MKFIIVDSPGEMLMQAQTYLAQHEATNNLPLGLLIRLAKEEQTGCLASGVCKPFLAIAKNDTESVSFFIIQTPPYNYIISGEVEQIPEVVNWLVQCQRTIPGVTGEKELVKAFSSEWKKRTEQHGQVFMRQRIYRLDQVITIPRRKGRLHLAKKQDIPLVTNWILGFHKEALTPTTKKEAQDFAITSIENKTIYLWKNEHGRPVSMAKRARGTEKGVAVSAVYTPDEYKRRGYATTCVATLSERLLDEGFHFCCLYTDIDNPTSNRIYTRIGYRPVADSLDYRFKI